MFHLRLHLRRYLGCSTELKLTLLSLLLWTRGRGMVRGFSPSSKYIYIYAAFKQNKEVLLFQPCEWYGNNFNIRSKRDPSSERFTCIHKNNQVTYLTSPQMLSKPSTMPQTPPTPANKNSREERGHNNHWFIAMIHNLHWGDSARVFSQWGHRRLWFGDVLCLSGSWLCPPGGFCLVLFSSTSSTVTISVPP